MDERESALQEVLLQLNHLSGSDEDMLRYAATQLIEAMRILAEDTPYEQTALKIAVTYVKVFDVS